MRKFELASLEDMRDAVPFAVDKNYGTLFITRNGMVLCFYDNSKTTVLRLLNEKGGWDGCESIFRWYDKETGKRKKTYINSLIKTNFKV
jgi:hypothetical protein